MSLQQPETKTSTRSDQAPDVTVAPVSGRADDGEVVDRPMAGLFVHRATNPSTARPNLSRLAPEVVGLDVLDAYSLARGSGLRLTVSIWETKVGPWGMVLSQQPEAGSRVRPGARIHVVAAGRPHRIVPDLRGRSTDDARRVLRKAGLTPVIAEGRRSRTIPPGHVISSRPAAGTLVVDGTPVTLTISRARPRPSGDSVGSQDSPSVVS